MTLGLGSDSCRSSSAADSKNVPPTPCGDAAFRDEMWRKDATWPVKEGGYVKEVNNNWSLDIDIGITRRTMRVGTQRRVGITVREQKRPRSNPLVYQRFATSGLPSVPLTMRGRGSPRSLPCSSPQPLPPWAPPTPSASSTAEPGRASASPASQRFIALKPRSARGLSDRRCESAMACNMERLRRSALDTSCDDAAPRCKSAMGVLNFSSSEMSRKRMSPKSSSPGPQEKKQNEDGWLPEERAGSRATDASESSESTPRTLLPVTIDPPRTRSAIVRWCFRCRRDAIESRLLLLDRSVLGDEHRTHIYTQRYEEARQESEVGNLIALYKKLGLKTLPQIGHPAALESWQSWEGGFSRTSEIVNALEVLNFYRWLCRVPRLKLDSFRQELADVVLQVLMKRDPRVHMQQEGVAGLDRFFEDVPKYVSGNGGRSVVVSHLPAAPAAVRALFSGLPNYVSSSDALFGADLPPVPVSDTCKSQSHSCLPAGASAGLRDYLPFLQLGVPREEDPQVLGELGHGTHYASISVKRKVQCMNDAQVFQSFPAQSPEVERQKRSSRAWGDTRGIVAFRRAALDPRLRNTGLLRRGCKTCVWIDTQIDGEPEVIPEDAKPPLSMSFLDIEALEDKSVKVKPSSQLRNLQRWREDVSRRITSGDFSEGSDAERRKSFQPLASRVTTGRLENASAGGSAVFHAPHARSSLIATFASIDSNVVEEPMMRTISILERQISTESKDTSQEIEDALREYRAMQYNADLGDDDRTPLMVCFPPPGIVPIEVVSETPLLWTISLDHQRLTPTSKCSVQVFRVQIDVEESRAVRSDNRAVPLSTFTVDCTNVGTPFCVIFKLAVDVQVGDQFEIVLDGLAGVGEHLDPISDLTYFVSFESFRPGVWDDGVLRQRACNLLRDQSSEHLWQDPFMFVPDLHHEDDTHASVHARGVGAGGGQTKIDRLNYGGRSSEFSDRSPPPIGLVRHPSATGNGKQGTYAIDVPCGNEVLQVLLVPSSIILKASLQVFVKSNAKWESLPNAVFMTFYREETPEQASHAESESLLPWGNAMRQADPFLPVPPQRHRVVFRIMLPVAGQYELRLNWGFVPSEPALCRSLLAVPTPHPHPLRIAVTVGVKVPNFRPLVPSMYHSTVKRLGYPLKHLLAEHWGVTVIGPLRYRLRMGFVRFTVLVKQGRPALNETDAMVAGAQAVGNKKQDHAGLRPETPTWNSEGSLDGRQSVVTRRTLANAAASASQWDASMDLSNSLAARTPKGINSKVLAVSNQVRRSEGRVTFKEGATRVDVEVQSHSTDSDDDSNEKVQGEQPGEKQEAVITEICLDEVQRRSKQKMKHLIRQGTNGKICIIAVVGSWRRVELLRRRPLEPPPAPSSILDMAAIVGSAVSSTAADAGVAKDTEVHEAILHITEEDQSQVVQLLAFQIGAAESTETLDINHLFASGASAPSECGSDAARPRRKTIRASAKRQSMVEKRARGYSASSDKGRSLSGVSFGERLPVAALSSDSHITKRDVEGPPPQLGQLSTPARWTLAEFMVEGANALPYDEDEMEKPLPAATDLIESIGFDSKD